jgi:hypothetical protein
MFLTSTAAAFSTIVLSLVSMAKTVADLESPIKSIPSGPNAMALMDCTEAAAGPHFNP